MSKKQTFPELEKALDVLGGYEAVGRVCHISGKAVQHWHNAGRLPRTEATGETDYAARLAAADPRICKEQLLASVQRGRTVSNDEPHLRRATDTHG